MSEAYTVVKREVTSIDTPHARHLVRVKTSPADFLDIVVSKPDINALDFAPKKKCPLEDTALIELTTSRKRLGAFFSTQTDMAILVCGNKAYFSALDRSGISGLWSIPKYSGPLDITKNADMLLKQKGLNQQALDIALNVFIEGSDHLPKAAASLFTMLGNAQQLRPTL